MNDWQSYSALGLVALAVLSLAWRWLKPKSSGCGGACACEAKKLAGLAKGREKAGQGSDMGQDGHGQ